ncbi:MAG: hypothetical protein HQL82_07300 [Magnetococcales bacterium]|nr:hypothetical protein [Magnetococcales bacterium]
MTTSNLTFISIDAAIRVLESGVTHPCYAAAEEYLARRLEPLEDDPATRRAAVALSEDEELLLLDQLEAEAQVAANLTLRIADAVFDGLVRFSRVVPPAMLEGKGL